MEHETEKFKIAKVTLELKRTSHLEKWAPNLELQSKSSLWRPPQSFVRLACGPGAEQ
jgi:hypothetical protein